MPEGNGAACASASLARQRLDKNFPDPIFLDRAPLIRASIRVAQEIARAPAQPAAGRRCNRAGRISQEKGLRRHGPPAISTPCAGAHGAPAAL